MERETQTWYRVSKYFDLGKIEAREIVRYTTGFVMYTVEGFRGQEERREGKDTEYYRWLPTEVQAVDYARSILSARRDGLAGQLARAESALAAFNAEHPET